MYYLIFECDTCHRHELKRVPLHIDTIADGVSCRCGAMVWHFLCPQSMAYLDADLPCTGIMTPRLHSTPTFNMFGQLSGTVPIRDATGVTGPLAWAWLPDTHYLNRYPEANFHQLFQHELGEIE